MTLQVDSNGEVYDDGVTPEVTKVDANARYELENPLVGGANGTSAYTNKSGTYVTNPDGTVDFIPNDSGVITYTDPVTGEVTKSGGNAIGGSSSGGSAGGGSNVLKGLLDKATTPAGLAALATLLGAAMGMNKPNASPGWKGTIDPNAYVANMQQIEQPEYQPYSGKPVMGGRQFTDISYSKKGEAAPAPTVNGVPLADYLGRKGLGSLPKDFGPKENDQAGPLQPGESFTPKTGVPSFVMPDGSAVPEGKFYMDGRLFDNQENRLAVEPPPTGWQSNLGPDDRPMTMDIKPGDIIGFNGTNPILAQANTGNILQETMNANLGGFAMGGIANLAHGGRYLHGATDGMADKLDTTIDGTQAAKLSHGEFVIPADVVSHLGNGNSTAGADVLYKMMDRVRKARTGNPKQGKQINPEKFMPGGLAALPAYANGGAIAFETGDLVKAPGTTATGMPATNESNLSSWAGPGISDYIQRGTAIAKQPYQAYKGPLTAGTSPLQQQAFTAAGNLSTPGSIAQAAAGAGDVAAKMGQLSYTPATMTNQFTAPGAYQASNNANQYTATSPYNASNITSNTFGAEQAQQYMNPYLQASLDPQLAEARRQSQMTQMANAARATQAGAFGGSRGALMDIETQRNLGTNLANITGQGYNTAYNNAMTQFNSDQGRNLQAQQANEASRQFGANQALSNAQNTAQYGLAGLNANEASRQFGANQAMTAAQQQAQYGNLAQSQTEQSRQYGNTFGLNALQDQLGAYNSQGNLGAIQNTAGLANLNAMTAAGNAQRDIEAQGIAAKKAAFEEERNAPMANILATQALYRGLPVSTVTSSTATTPAMDIGKAIGQGQDVYKSVDELLNGKKP